MSDHRIIPAKNGGWLTAGNPGNRGGGCTPASVRDAARAKLPAGIKVLGQILKAGEDCTPLEKVAALRALHEISGLNRERKIVISYEEIVSEACSRVCGAMPDDAIYTGKEARAVFTEVMVEALKEIWDREVGQTS